MELSREEFEVLWKVEHSWENNPEYASDNTNESIAHFTKIFLQLESKQLIFIHIANNKIESANLTDRGLEVLTDAKYYEWSKELMSMHNLDLTY